MSKKLKLGLIGNNISYSLSPRLHEYCFARKNLAATYELLDLDLEELRNFAPIFLSDPQWIGLNVTTPYKEVAEQLFGASPNAVHSINTVVKSHAGISCHSTDSVGFERALEHASMPISRFESLAFLGNGGAVSAVLKWCSKKAKLPRTIKIMRRSHHRDETFQNLIGDSQSHISFCDIGRDIGTDLCDESDNTLLVIAIPTGSVNELQHLNTALRQFRGFIFDMNYRPPSDCFQLHRNDGKSGVDGLPMLVGQALAAQKLWFGEELCPFEEVLSYMRDAY